MVRVNKEPKRVKRDRDSDLEESEDKYFPIKCDTCSVEVSYREKFAS